MIKSEAISRNDTHSIFLSFSFLTQAIIAASIIFGQFYFRFPAEDTLTPAGFYMLANVIAVSGLSIAAAFNADRDRVPLLCVGGAFAAFFLCQLGWDDETLLSDVFTVGVWLFVAFSLAYLIRAKVQSTVVRRIFVGAIALQGVAVVCDLLELSGLNFVYLASSLASMAAYQLALLYVITQTGDEPDATASALGQNLKMRVTEALSDRRYRVWRTAHPGGTYADYYAYKVERKLAKGAAHKTLGVKQLGTGGAFAAADDLDVAEFRSRGVSYLNWFVERGLRQDMTCVEYGCGSLRVGQHFIRHLDADRYVGLDVTDTFYELGITRLEDGLLADKRPRFGKIRSDQYRMAASLKPDIVYSTAVLQHVPEVELEAYFSSLLGLVPANGVAVANFKSGDMKTIGQSSWTYEPGRIFGALFRVDPTINAAVVDGWRSWDGQYQQSMLVMARRPELLGPWTRASSGRFRKPAPGRTA